MEPFLKPDTPVLAYIEPTLRCNHKCMHCYVENRKPSANEELNAAEWGPVFDELARLGTLILVFTGGEIFLRPDLFDILKTAREKGFAIVLFTNGTHITEEIAEKIHDTAPLGVEISLHGGNPAAHDAITGIQGSFDRALSGIRLLKNAGVPVKIKGNLMQSNRGEYDALIDLAQTLGAEFSFDPFIFPCRDGDTHPIEQRVSDNRLKEIIMDRRLVKKRTTIDAKSPLENPDNRLCGAGSNVMAVSCNGDVFPCVPLKMKIGNVRTDRLSTLWSQSPVLKKLRSLRVRDLKQCTDCPDKQYCVRCSALSLNETGDLLGCSPLFRKISRVRAELVDKTTNNSTELADA